MVQALGESACARTGDDAEHKLLGSECATQLCHHRPKHLWLHPQKDHVGAPGGLGVVGGGGDPSVPLQLFASLSPGMAAHDVSRAHEIPLEETRQHGLGHHARADDADVGVVQGGFSAHGRAP